MIKLNYIDVCYNKDEALLIWAFKSDKTPQLSLDFLKEFKQFSKWVKHTFSTKEKPLKYIVSASDFDGIYNLGADTNYIVDCIKQGHRKRLIGYAISCVDFIYTITSSFHLPIITIALVEGKAFGGGFESAMSHDFVIAKHKAKFCLSDFNYNLFPVMRASKALKEVVQEPDDTPIKSKQMFDMGLVEKVVNDNQTIFSLNAFVGHINTDYKNEYSRIMEIKHNSGITKTSFFENISAWVEHCLQISKLELHKIEVLSKQKSYSRVRMIKDALRMSI